VTAPQFVQLAFQTPLLFLLAIPILFQVALAPFLFHPVNLPLIFLLLALSLLLPTAMSLGG